MASTILSAFPRPPAHIPTANPNSNGSNTSTSPRPSLSNPASPRPSFSQAPPTPYFDAPLWALPTSNSESDSLGTATLPTPSTSTSGPIARPSSRTSSERRRSYGRDSSENKRERERDRGERDRSRDRDRSRAHSKERKPSASAGVGDGDNAQPRMSVESTIAFADRAEVDRSTSMRSSQYSDGQRLSVYSQQSLPDGNSSGSSSHSHAMPNRPVSILSSRSTSRPTSGLNLGPPPTAPLNVPLSASARIAALRAKRAGLGTLNLKSTNSTAPPSSFPSNDPRSSSSSRQSWTTNLGIASAGPPPTVPLPPIPTGNPGTPGSSDRPPPLRSINLESPNNGGAYPFPRQPPPGELPQTPTTSTTAAFRLDSPSARTFGHVGHSGQSVAASVAASVKDGYHSRASSYGSTIDIPHFRQRNRSATGNKLGMLGNASTTTFGHTNAEDMATPTTSHFSFNAPPNGPTPPVPKHNHTLSTASAWTAASGYTNYTLGPVPDNRMSVMSTSRDSFVPAGGLAALAALAKGEEPKPASTPPNLSLPQEDAGDEDETFDVQKELERIRKERERRDKRMSSGSILSTFSTRTNNTFRGAGSRVMDVSPEDVQDDETAEMAGERLLGSVGDDLESLVPSWGPKRPPANRLGVGRSGASSNAGSRPGSSRGPSNLSPAVSRPTSMASFKKSTPALESADHSPSESPLILPNGTPSYARRSSVQFPNVDGEEDDTITLNRLSHLAPESKRNPRETARESIFSLYTRQDDDEDMEPSQSNAAGSGYSRNSVAGASSKGSSRPIPDVTVDDVSSQERPMNNRAYDGYRSDDEGQLVTVKVWDDAPTTPGTAKTVSNWPQPDTDDEHPKSKGQGYGNGHGHVEAGMSVGRPSLSESTSSHSRNLETPRPARSPSPSTTSLSHSTATVTPFIRSAKPSLDIERPDTAMSTESRRKFAPPALQFSQATPLSSQTSLALQGEDEDGSQSPSAGRNGPPRRKVRDSTEFAQDMEQEFADGPMRGEFALLQEVAIREKRLKLALFGRGNQASSLTRPGALRPHSMAAISKKLPDSPTRRDGASSPEIEEMIKKGRRSLSASARKMRRRRSTGALRNSDGWRRSDIDRALAAVPALPRTPLTGGSTKFEGRRGLDLDRDSLDLTGMVDSPDVLEDDPNLDSDSSIDLHTPLPRLMLRAGLLSPHSKILRPPTPEEPMPMGNSLKVPQDRRNTEKRKRRHRDGRLLREGVGLTTGLGWSDSEDEDAPSALTRRLSMMTLNSSVSRKASMASSMNFSTASLSRSPSMPQIALASRSLVSLSSKHSSSSSETTSRFTPPKRTYSKDAVVPYGHPVEPPTRPQLPPSSTMSIIEHAQMLPTASLYSRNHPLGAGMRRPTFNFAIENRRSSSPAGNSSQSSTGVPAFPVTPDADLPPSLGGPLLKEMSTPEDIHGLSGGSSVTMGSVSFIGAGTGLVGLNASRGRSFTTPSSPTPITVALLPDDDEPMPTKPRPAEARYSGGNFSYPTRAALSNEDGAQKSDMKRLAPPRGLQPLTLPGVVAAGGRLSPRAGGTFALPSSPSLIATKPTTTPKKSNLPLPGGATSKSSGNIATAAPTSYGSRSRSGSTNSNSGIAPLTPTTPSNLKSSTAARKNGTLPPRSRTLSGAGNGILGPNAVPPTASSIATPKRTLGNLRSIVTGKTLAAAATADASGLPKTLGVARATSAPGSPRARFGAPSPSGKTGAGMAYRKSAGAVNVMAEASTPARSGLPPPSASRLMAPGSLIRPASQQSLTPSVVGVAL